MKLKSQPRRSSRMILQPGDLMMGGPWVKSTILKSPQIRPFLFSFTFGECKYPIRTVNSANRRWKAVKRMKLNSWLCTIGCLRTGEFILGNAKGKVMFHGRLKWRPFVILLKASAVKTVNEHYFTVNWRQQARKRIQLNSQPRRSSRMILQPGDLMMGGLWVKIKILKSPHIRPFLFSFTSGECKYPIRTANSANGRWKAVKRMKCGLLAAYCRMVTDGWIYTG